VLRRTVRLLNASIYILARTVLRVLRAMRREVIVIMFPPLAPPPPRPRPDRGVPNPRWFLSGNARALLELPNSEIALPNVRRVTPVPLFWPLFK